MWARDARPSGEPSHMLLDLSNRSCGSNHRLVWRSLGVRTKMSVKTRLPRSRRVHFRYGSKSLIAAQILDHTSQFFCASLMGFYLFLKWPLFRGFYPRFVAKGGYSGLGRLNIYIYILDYYITKLWTIQAHRCFIANSILLAEKDDGWTREGRILTVHKICLTRLGLVIFLAGRDTKRVT